MYFVKHWDEIYSITIVRIACLWIIRNERGFLFMVEAKFIKAVLQFHRGGIAMQSIIASPQPFQLRELRTPEIPWGGDCTGPKSRAY
jgi:hypothetical protein